MKKKINLESIILEVYGCKDAYDFQKSYDISMQMIKEICIKACKETLELATKNAKINIKKKSQFGKYRKWRKVKETGESIDLLSYEVQYYVDKDSIIKTINQIE